MTEKKNYSGMDLLEKAEKGGLNYINKEKSYLKISTVFPIYSLCIITLNILFILIGAIFLRYSPLNPPVPDLTLEEKLVLGLYLLIPSVVFFILFLFSIIQFLFLKKWKFKIKEYNQRYGMLNSNQNNSNISESEGTSTLTSLFYDIIRHMEKVRWVFYIINILSFFYLWWSFRLFGAIIFLLVKEVHGFFPFMLILNFSSSIVLVFFLIYMWIHFRRWNRKLTKIKEFEKNVSKELHLDP